KEMHQVMEQSVDIFRSESGLKEACNKIEELKDRFSSILIEDKSLNFNTELTSALELENMIDVAESIIFSALSRRESRGSHQRTDFVNRDDENFLRHSLAYRTEAESRIEYQDVVITKWPPAERIYGKEE
ncbi:MAG: succinate dehydrogenase/fumarate reductase flavoprotein subunit, partial [SAR324 cluster bacterium]